jgi:hypothetical protein
LTTRERDEALAGDESDSWMLATPAEWENVSIDVELVDELARTAAASRRS